MARSAVEERIINMPIDAIIQRMRGVGAEKNFALRSENPSQNGVWFRVHHGASMTSWGEKITVTLTPMGQQTMVKIHSECGMPTQLIDYGKNKKVVAYLFDFIMRSGYGQPNVTAQVQYRPYQVPQNQGYAQQAPQPAQPKSAAQKRFCTNCGTPSAAGMKFCMKCGKPLS